MKYRSLWAGLAALGAAALLLTLTLKKGAEGLLMWAFPMAQMGSLLRQLSMSGAVGNFVAWILYFAVGLLPLLWLGWRVYRKCTQPEDCLLVLLSGVLFGVLYAMINAGGPAGEYRRCGWQGAGEHERLVGAVLLPGSAAAPCGAGRGG